MGKKEFTKEQLLAINTRDKTLLVSAAAGSGKTATLTERIIQSLIDEENPINITDMLIVTFTNAAVRELKERIESALRAKLAEFPKNQHLIYQINMLPSARISTIDSFCNDILKGNAEKFGISPKYRIADPIEASILSRSVLSAIIESGYNGELTLGADDFEELADCLVGVKNDYELEDIIMFLYEHSKSHKDGASIFRRFAELHKSSSENFEESIYVKYAANSARALAAHYLDIYSAFIAEYTENEKDSELFKGIILEAIALLEKIKDAPSFKSIYSMLLLPFPQMPAKRSKTPLEDMASKLHKELKDAISKLNEKFFVFSESDWTENFKKLSKLTQNLATVIEIFDKIYFEEKKKRKILEYSDIERLAYLCLYSQDGNITDFAKSLKKEFAAVYIDEYQDVNSLQDEIFKAVSKENNRFMVGDIKQSIYGFRGAEPAVFASMKESFPSSYQSEQNCMSIFMSQNFRCDDEIIEFVNAIYDKMFELNGKSIGYVAEDRLTVGKQHEAYYEPRIPEIRLFTKEDVPEKQEEEEEEIALGSLSPEWTAKKISEIIFREKLNSGDYIRPSDIAIILRNDSGRSKVYADALKKYGISAEIPDDKNFFLNPDVQLALCLLNSIDNPRRDIYLTGLMLSPLYSFTADELHIAKKSGAKNSLWESLNVFAKKSTDEKLNSFINTLNKYREMSEGMRTDALILKLYNETGLLSLAEKNGGKENLLLLYNYARKFESSSFEGLYNFITYLNTAIASGAKFTVQSENSADAVSIITAHKSKGLEFPVVFIADIASPLISANERRNRIAYSDDFGFAMKTRADGGLATVNSPVYNAIVEHNVDMRLEEELRVYYVALTRARERLYITGAIKSASKGKYIDEIHLKALFPSPYTLKEMKTFVDILHMTPHKARIDWGRNFENDNLETEAPVLNFEEDIPDFSEQNKLTASELLQRFSFKYPKEHMTALPEKMSISNLYPTVLDGNADEEMLSIDVSSHESGSAFRLPEFICTESSALSAKKGSATHAFLQFCDFPALRKHGAKAELSRLVESEFISLENSKLVRLDEIERFSNSRLFNDITNAKELFREFRISVMLPAEFFTSDKIKKEAYKNNELLLQGVIDCLYSDSNGDLHLIDYKTDRLCEEELIDRNLAEKTLSDRHSLQLSYYALAVEKIFGKKPISVEIYSLHLGDTITVKTLL